MTIPAIYKLDNAYTWLVAAGAFQSVGVDMKANWGRGKIGAFPSMKKRILNKISLKYVLYGLIHNMALVPILAWRQIGDTSLS